MEKIKISKELNIAILSAMEDFRAHDDMINSILEYAAKNKWYSERKPLNDLNVHQLAEILIKGCEVEETPEETLSKTYNNKAYGEFDKAFDEGILYTLETLGIKIKGINT